MAKDVKKPIKTPSDFDETDYFTPSPDRPLAIKVRYEGKIRTAYVDKKFCDAYFRIFQDERKRLDRESRCLVPGKSGKLVRCEAKCEECPFGKGGIRDGMAISPEFLMEEYELDVEGDDDVAEEYAEAEMNEALHREISLLPKRDRTILNLKYWEDRTADQIARVVGMSQTGVLYRLKALHTLLGERLSKYRK